LAEAPNQLLILGTSEITGLAARFGALLTADARSPLLIVYRAQETRA
jgi:trans-2-enoyl-CoA reductase